MERHGATMKTLATLTLLVAFVTSYGQSIDWTKNTTPPLGSVYELTYSSAGEAYALAGFPLYEVEYSLPFSMNVKAGHGFVWGTKMSDLVSDAHQVWGYGVYASRDIGGRGFFVKGSLAMVYDPQDTGKKFDFVVGGSLGFRF